MFIKKYFDKYMKIITCIKNSPKPIKDISSETNITINTVYRIIEKLDRDEMLLKKGIITKNKKSVLFQSKTNFLFIEKKLDQIFPESTYA